MIRQRRSTWPPELGPDTAHDRARVISRGWRALAIDLATNPHTRDQALAKVAALEQMCRQVGEAGWQIPSPSPGEGEWMTREQVATRGGVRPDVVSNWTGRGLTRGGQRRTLTRHPEGYHPDEVADFLHWRDTPQRAPRRREKTPPCPSLPARPSLPTATGGVLPADRRSTSTP